MMHTHCDERVKNLVVEIMNEAAALHKSSDLKAAPMTYDIVSVTRMVESAKIVLALREVRHELALSNMKEKLQNLPYSMFNGGETED